MSLLLRIESWPGLGASQPSSSLSVLRARSLALSLILPALIGCSAGSSSSGAPNSMVAQGAASASAEPAFVTHEPSPSTHGSEAKPPIGDPNPFFAPPPGEKLPGGSRSHHRASVAGAHLILSGGVDSRLRSLPDLLHFNLKRGAFERLPIMLHEPRHRHSATVLPGLDGELGTNDDAILFAGGQGDDGALSSLELLTADPDGDGDCRDARIEVLGRLPLRIADHAASLTRLPTSPEDAGRVLIVGGLAELDDRPESAPTNAAFLVDLRQDPYGHNQARIESCPQSPSFARIEHSLVWLLGPDQRPGGDDDRLVLIGGRGLEPRSDALEFASDFASAPRLSTIAEIELFDPTQESWTLSNLEPTDEEPRGAAELSVLVARTRQRVLPSASGLILVGGIDDVGAVVTEALEIQFNSLGEASGRVLGQLCRGRQDPEVVALSAGRWLITGGYGYDERQGGYGPLKTAEIYDPQGSPAFSELSCPMFSARLYHSIAESGGRIVLSGGYSGASRSDLELASPDVEVFSEPRSKP